MTKLLDKAVAAIAALSDDRQDEAALVLLQFAGIEPPLELTAEDERELAASLAEEAAGEFASEDEIRAIWAKHGR
jgi:hypothetical protein